MSESGRAASSASAAVELGLAGSRAETTEGRSVGLDRRGRLDDLDRPAGDGREGRAQDLVAANELRDGAAEGLASSGPADVRSVERWCMRGCPV